MRKNYENEGRVMTVLSIGEFSNICKVSAKTLRYYEEIGLLLPDMVNPENGYRYYSIEQLETMLLIHRLKSYNFSLEEIREILEEGEMQGAKLFLELGRKEEELRQRMREMDRTLKQLQDDMSNLKQGKSMMSYLDNIDVQLTEVPLMNLLSVRKMVQEHDFEKDYGICYGGLLKKIEEEKLTMAAPPMVLFHSAQYTDLGLDTEFAIPVKEYVKGTRDFSPGLCLKTVLKGAYSNLPSIYTKQREWAEREGYNSSGAVFEVYVTDPSQTLDENDLITEVYYPVKKKTVR